MVWTRRILPLLAISSGEEEEIHAISSFFLFTIELTKTVFYGILIALERMGIMNKKEALELLDSTFKDYYRLFNKGKVGDRTFVRNHVSFYFTLLNAKENPDLLVKKPLRHYQASEAKGMSATMLEIVNYLKDHNCQEMIVGIEAIYFPLDDEGKWYGSITFHPC